AWCPVLGRQEGGSVFRFIRCFLLGSALHFSQAYAQKTEDVLDPRGFPRSHAEDETRRDLIGTSGCLWFLLGLFVAGFVALYFSETRPLYLRGPDQKNAYRQAKFAVMAMFACLVLGRLSLILIGSWTGRLKDPVPALVSAVSALFFLFLAVAV